MIPRVHTTKHVPTPGLMAWAQAIADAAFGTGLLSQHGFETDAFEICAAKGPVKPHTDDHPGTDGMRIHGLVLRSDGHRLHTDALHAAGVVEGIELKAGDLYVMDVTDRHWTTVPEGAYDAQLIFSVYIMAEDGRKPKALAHDIFWSALAASIQANTRTRTA
jgi:hypothetical protein